jgi:hypothetical protein
MRIAGVFAIAALFGLAIPASAQQLTYAPAAGRELRQICTADAGRLWNVTLCGPLLVVDPQTRLAWSSDPDQLGLLQQNGEGWMGALPAGVPIANTSVDWAGARWIMVMAPLPEDATQRRVLIAHEAWHRAQSRIGLIAQNSDCTHLESERGRYFLRLEMRALATALRSRGRAREQASREAIMFRAARLAVFPAGVGGEAALDRNEGLASYTGVKLGAGDNAETFATRTLDDSDTNDAYARTYAYATGPAYGLLLDTFRPSWRGELGVYTPADLLTMAVRAQTGDARALGRAADRYGGPAIAIEERQRAATHAARIADLRARFANGPRLQIDLRQFQFEYDPNGVTPVEGLGSFYSQLTLRDAWGEIRAANGAVISADFRRLTASAPGPDGRSGPGWTVTLNPGYGVAPPDQSGVMRIISVPPAQ